VLLDAVLPTHDGFYILTHIRRYTRLRDLPVVMVTAQINDEDVVRG
jgi:DNA-binding response OmpR family regulator